MPPQNDRRWLTSEEIGLRLTTWLVNNGNIAVAAGPLMEVALGQAFRDFVYGNTLVFTQNRLLETVRDDVVAGRISTFEQLRDRLLECFDEAFLEQHDEEGNPIDA